MKNKKLFSIAIFIVVAVLAFSACTPTQKAQPTEATTTKQPTKTEEKKVEDSVAEEDTQMEEETMEFTGDAYNFTLTDVDGNVHKLSEYTGKKVYIKFWATWCSICLSGMNEFIEFDESQKDNEDVVVLTMISPKTSGEMSSEDFKKWYDSQGLKFKVMLDEGGKSMREYGIRGFPTSVFIDSNGDVFDIKIGHVSNEIIEDTLSQMQ